MGLLHSDRADFFLHLHNLQKNKGGGVFRVFFGRHTLNTEIFLTYPKFVPYLKKLEMKKY